MVLPVACLFILLAGNVKPEWKTQETGIYRPIVHREVAVNELGRIFLVNRDEAKILCFDEQGRKLAAIGGKGEGPGELELPTWLYLMGDKLYVEDAKTNAISVFSQEGKFLERLFLPTRNLVLAKVADGWVYGDWETTDDQSRPIGLFLADEKLANPVKLHSWTRPADNSSPMVQSDGSSRPIVPINPAGDTAHLAVSRKGDLIFLVQQGSDDLRVFDSSAKKLLRLIQNQFNAVPFNEDWGMEYMTSFKDGLSERMVTMIDFRPNFPSHFPLVKSLRTLSDGMIAMEMWTGLPGKKTDVHIFDGSAEVKDYPLDGQVIARLVYARGSRAYLTAFDPQTEEASIVCVDRKLAGAFVQSNPIDYDGPSGEDVVVER